MGPLLRHRPTLVGHILRPPTGDLRPEYEQRARSTSAAGNLQPFHPRRVIKRHRARGSFGAVQGSAATAADQRIRPAIARRRSRRSTRCPIGVRPGSVGSPAEPRSACRAVRRRSSTPVLVSASVAVPGRAVAAAGPDLIDPERVDRCRRPASPGSGRRSGGPTRVAGRTAADPNRATARSTAPCTSRQPGAVRVAPEGELFGHLAGGLQPLQPHSEQADPPARVAAGAQPAQQVPARAGGPSRDDPSAGCTVIERVTVVKSSNRTLIATVRPRGPPGARDAPSARPAPAGAARAPRDRRCRTRRSTSAPIEASAPSGVDHPRVPAPGQVVQLARRPRRRARDAARRRPSRRCRRSWPCPSP